MQTTTKRTRAIDIASELRKEIAIRQLAPGAPVMSTREIAEFFGVSPLTADRAVRQLVDEGVLYRIKGSGTFVKTVSNMNGAQRIRVGLANTEVFRVPAQQTFADRAVRVFHDSGVEIKPLPYNYVRDPELARSELAELDGILFSAHYLDDQTEKALREFNKPVVMFRFDFIRDEPFHQVVLDFVPAYQEIFDRIDDFGKRRLTVLFEGHRNGLFRMNKLLEIAIARGWPEELIRRVEVAWDTGWDITNYRLGCKLAEDMRGDFIFSTSDIACNIFLNAFDDCGLRAKIDYDLVSCDNLEGVGFKPWGEPRLTSVDCPYGDLTAAAAALLLEVIKNPSPNSHILRLPTTLVIRSTAFAESKQYQPKGEKI